MRLILLITSLLLASSFNLDAQEEMTKEKFKKIAKLQGASNVGRDFWISVPPAYIETFNPNDFIKFFIISPIETQVTIESQDGFFQQVSTIPNEATEVNLTPGEAQPYVFSYLDGNQTTRVVEGKALHITAKDPIVLYCVVRYQFTSDGFLCIPTPALGTEYVASPYSSRPINETSLPNMVTVVAPYDNTTVDLTVGGNLLTVVPLDNGAELVSGDQERWILDQGDVLVISNAGNNQTISGSLIEADKPIAVISGHYCADIPVGTPACDYNVEMDIPTKTWGQHYHIPLVKDRVFPSILRVFAKEDDTRFYRNGRELGVIREGLGGIEGDGWQEIRVWPKIENNGDIALYSGDKPIYVMMYNPGQLDDRVQSDPFSMLITPIEQYQTEITFATPGVQGGAPFTLNFLNIVYQADENGLAPEDLEWGTDPTVQGFQYTSIRNIGGIGDDYFNMEGSEEEWIRNSPFAGNRYQHKPHELPGIGVYNVRGPLPFAVYSYGYANFDSYGFPTSTALRNLEIDDPFAPTAVWEFGCETDFVLTGQITEQPEDQARRISGIYGGIQVLESENFSEMEEVVGNFDQNSGAMLFLNFRTEVIDKSQPARIVFGVVDGADNSATFTETYFPEEYEFYAENGEADTYQLYNDGVPYPDGELDTEYFVIENTSPEKELLVEDIFMQNNNQNFTFLDGSFELDGNLLDPQPAIPLAGPITIPVGSSLRFGVEFSSTDARVVSWDSLGVETCSYDRLYAVRVQAVKGGPRINTIDPQPFAFTQIDESLNEQIEQGPRRYTISNGCPDGDGTTPLTIVAIQGPTDPQFRTDIEASLPLTIEPGGDREFNVWFRSNGNAGNFNDQIVFITDPAGLEECRNFIELEASAGSTELDAQGFAFDILNGGPVDLYEFIQGGQQALMADGSQSDYAPITVKNLSEDAGFAVDVNGGEVTLNSPESANKFYFDAAGTMNLEDDATFDGELASNNLQAGNVTPTSNVYYLPNATGNFGITYKATATSDGGVELETPEYEITGSAVVANLAIYKNADAEDAGVIDFGTSIYPTPLPVQTFEITNRRFDGDYTYGNTAIFTLDLQGIGYGAEPFIIQNVEFADGTPYNGPNLDQANITLEPGRTLVVTVAYSGDYTDGDIAGASVSIQDHNTLGDGAVIANTGPWNDELTFQAEVTNVTAVGSADDFVPAVCVGNTVRFENGEFSIVNNSNNPFQVTGNPVFNEVNNNNAGFDLEIVNMVEVDAANVETDLGLVDLNANPLTLQPGESLQFDVEYTPTQDFGNKDMTVEYFTDIDEVDGVNEAPDPQPFVITTITYEKSIVLSAPTGNDLEIGDRLQVALSLEGNDDITPAAVTELQGFIEYRRGYLVADYASLALSDEYANNFTLNYDINNVTDEFVPRAGTNKDNWMRRIPFTITSNDGTPVNTNGVIVTLEFDVLLGSLSLGELPEGRSDENIFIAQDVNNPDDFRVTIDADLRVTGLNSCAVINPPDEIDVTLSTECAYQFRTVALTGSSNESSRVSRTPVTSTGADIEFSLALDGETTVTIYDTNGNEVSTILNKYLDHGQHKVQIPVNELANGVYMYEVKSQFYTSSNKFIISK